MSETITGGCLCGAARFSLSEPPTVARTCWCRLCQHIGAGGPTVNVGFPAATLQVEGPLTTYDSIADSGSHMHRSFCPVCGSHVFSQADERPHMVFVRAGALDDPDLVAPASTIWTTQAPKWACIDADLPQHPHQAPPGS